MTVRARRIAVGVGLVGAWLGCSAQTDSAVAGTTMGTTDLVRVAVSNPPELEEAVAAVLEPVDARRSTWRDDSELERFNRHKGTGWLAVSAETALVAQATLDLVELLGVEEFRRFRAPYQNEIARRDHDPRRRASVAFDARWSDRSPPQEAQP